LKWAFASLPRGFGAYRVRLQDDDAAPLLWDCAHVDVVVPGGELGGGRVVQARELRFDVSEERVLLGQVRFLAGAARCVGGARGGVLGRAK
jgi:hypothetical protein